MLIYIIIYYTVYSKTILFYKSEISHKLIENTWNQLSLHCL